MKHTTKEQFPATTIFRAIVMIGCLVIIPLVAIFGTSLPEAFKNNKPGAQTRRDAQNVDPTQRQTKEPDGLSESPSFPRSAWERKELVNMQSVPTQSVGTRKLDGIVEVTQSVPGPANVQKTLRRPSKVAGNIHADFQMPIDANQNTLKNVKESSQAPKDLCTQIEYRLRELGASYYRLEHWGAEGMLYRFQCNVPVDESTQRSKLFQATDEDRTRAMQRVLKQVESWKSRQPPITSRSVQVPGG